MDRRYVVSRCDVVTKARLMGRPGPGYALIGTPTGRVSQTNVGRAASLLKRKTDTWHELVT